MIVGSGKQEQTSYTVQKAISVSQTSNFNIVIYSTLTNKSNFSVRKFYISYNLKLSIHCMELAVNNFDYLLIT